MHANAVHHIANMVHCDTRIIIYYVIQQAERQAEVAEVLAALRQDHAAKQAHEIAVSLAVSIQVLHAGNVLIAGDCLHASTRASPSPTTVMPACRCESCKMKIPCFINLLSDESVLSQEHARQHYCKPQLTALSQPCSQMQLEAAAHVEMSDI